MTFVLLVLVGIAVVGFAAVALARSGRRDRDAAIELVPGTSSRVPVAWAGSHTPEARAHRRLVAAMGSARGAPGMSDGPGAVHLSEIVAEALRVEAQLLVAAAVPGERRAEAVRDAVGLVDHFESMVADLVLAVGRSESSLDEVVADAAIRLVALREALLEVEQIDRGRPLEE